MMTQDQVRHKVKQFITDSKLHTTMRDQKSRAETYQDFMRGGSHQWTQEEWDTYKSVGVNPITINRCKPVIKALVGMYLQSKQQVGVEPRRGGTSTVAQVHTEILKHTQDVSYADYVYAQVVMRGLIDTESYLKLEIDRGMNVNGQPVIKGLSLWDVYVDRNAIEYDLNESARYVIQREWKDQDELKAEYPDQEDKISRGMSQAETQTQMAERLATYLTTESANDQYDEDEASQIPDSELLKKYRYLLFRVFWKEVQAAVIVQDRQEQRWLMLTGDKQVRRYSRKARKSVRYKITNYAAKKLHESIMLGEQLLDDIVDPLGEGVTDYPIVRFCPIWDSGYASGALDDIVSLNKEENIHRTQTIRILNQTANSGFYVAREATQEYMKLLKNFGSVPGIVIPKDKFGGSVEKITPNVLPTGHFTLGQQFEQDTKRVSQVDDATQGYSTSQTESGRAINLKMQQNRLSSEVFFNDLYRSLEIFGNLMLKVHLHNRFYTDDEIKQIVSESSMIDQKLLLQAKAGLMGQLYGASLPQPQPLPPMDPNMMATVKNEDKPRILQLVQQGTQAAQQYAEAYPAMAPIWEEQIKLQAIEMLLQKLREDKGMYGVKVVVSPSAPTERMQQFLQMDALMKNYGPMIPLDVFIDLTDLPQKEEIKAKLAAQQQAQQMQAAPPQPRPVAARGAA